MTPPSGYCAKCEEHSAYLMPLHGERGGARCCLTCVGACHAEHGRKRNRGRVAIRAMQNFLDAGGSAVDLENLKLSAMMGKLGLAMSIDPLGYLHDLEIGRSDAVELTLELLTDVLVLAHPDKHPPERQDLARRVTQQLLAIKPFVFPAMKPKAEPPEGVKAPPSRNTSMMYNSETSKEVLRYPCATCASAAPHFYCDACRAEWDRRKSERRERESAKSRQKYKLRRQRQLQRLPQRRCAQCGKLMAKRRRRHVKFCSVACRVRAHRAVRRENNVENSIGG